MQLIVVVISLCLYIFAPTSYSRPFCALCALFYLLLYYLSIREEIKHKKYLSFSVLFGAILFISSFLVPLYLYSDELYLMQYMCKGSAMVVLAYSVYYSGWSRSFKKYSKVPRATFYIPPRISKWLNGFSLIITLIYIFLFLAFYRTFSYQTNDFNVIYFVPLLISILSTTLLCNTASNQSQIRSLGSFIRVNKVCLGCIAIIILTFLFIGDRTTPIYLTLTIVCVYTSLVKRIRLSLIIVVIPIAFILLWTVGQNRKSEIYNTNFGLKSAFEMSKRSVSDSEGVIDLFSDFYSASRSIYLCEDYVKRTNSHYYPGKIVVLLFNPFPFIPSFLANFIYHVPNSELSSGTLTTNQYNKVIGNMNGGMGTHSVADVFVSWGIIGVVLFYFLFGFLIGKSEQCFTSNVYYAVIYLSMFSNSVYIPRATLYDNYRLIAYCIFLIWVVQALTKQYIINTNGSIASKTE